MTGSQEDFERIATENSHHGLVGEFLGFLMNNKKWWLLPILLVLLFIALLVIAGGSGFAPFIYTLF